MSLIYKNSLLQRMVIELSEDDVMQAIVQKYLMKNAPQELYKIKCSPAAIYITLDEEDDPMNVTS